MPVRWIALLLPALLCLSGCPKRDTGEINVDQIQKVVDGVEDHLRGMRVALKSKKLDEAEDHYEEAQELMQDNQAQLSAYPEVGLLRERVQEADSDLCYGFANITLAKFFDAIREKSIRPRPVSVKWNAIVFLDKLRIGRGGKHRFDG